MKITSAYYALRVPLSGVQQISGHQLDEADGSRLAAAQEEVERQPEFAALKVLRAEILSLSMERKGERLRKNRLTEEWDAGIDGVVARLRADESSAVCAFEAGLEAGLAAWNAIHTVSDNLDSQSLESWLDRREGN